MRSNGRTSTRRSYQVLVRGRLGPALRAVFRDLRAAENPSTTVFRLQLTPGQGPADVEDLLRRKELVLVSMRAVPDAAELVPDLVPDAEHRAARRAHLTPVT